MADIDIPDDLIALQRRANEAAAATHAGRDSDQFLDLTRAQAAAVHELYQHPIITGGAPDRLKVIDALRKAARDAA